MNVLFCFCFLVCVGGGGIEIFGYVFDVVGFFLGWGWGHF